MRLMILLFLMIILPSCRTAEYEVVGKEKVGATEPSPCDGLPAQHNGTEDCPANHLPSADIEAYQGEKKISITKINEKVIFKATPDTLDPEDLGKDGQCENNPGIVTAIFEANDTQKMVKREKCENLEAEFTFAAPGNYPVVLTVITAEDERANASLNLRVVGADVDPAKEAEKGFDISADPLIINIDEKTTLRSNCKETNNKTTSWNLGDGNLSSGEIVEYSYQKEGQYIVAASCNGKNATLTIVVLPPDNKVPTEKPPIKKPPVTPPPVEPCDDPGQNPGQSPGQDPGQDPKQDPGQDPGQNPNQKCNTPEQTPSQTPKQN